MSLPVRPDTAEPVCHTAWDLLHRRLDACDIDANAVLDLERADRDAERADTAERWAA